MPPTESKFWCTLSCDKGTQITYSMSCHQKMLPSKNIAIHHDRIGRWIGDLVFVSRFCFCGHSDTEPERGCSPDYPTKKWRDEQNGNPRVLPTVDMFGMDASENLSTTRICFDPHSCRHFTSGVNLYFLTGPIFS